MTEIEYLTAHWLEMKELEREATEKRRNIEDDLLKLLNISDALEGTETKKTDIYTIKIVGRMNRKINADLLQELAVENGLTDHLSSLFIWKPDINLSVWKAADSSITKPLMAAITTTPSRPSFTIIEE